MANQTSKTYSVFPTMFMSDRLEPDHFVYTTLVKACASLCAIRQGKLPSRTLSVLFYRHFLMIMYCILILFSLFDDTENYELLHLSHASKWVLEILFDCFKSKSKSGDPIRVAGNFQYAMFCLLVLMCF